MLATFLLLTGAGSDSWYWHRVAPLLEARGHSIVAPDLPVDDDSAGFPEYTDVAARAVADAPGRPLIIVGQSMGAFTAVMTAERVPTSMLVLVGAMIPAPGETGGAWWGNTGQEAAQTAYAVEEGRDPDAAFDPFELFLHDVPAEVVKASAEHMRNQSETPFTTAWVGPEWPSIPTKVIAARYDRLFPLPFMQKISRDRLGIEPEIIDSGHLSALAKPHDLAARLLSYASELDSPPR
ncbi:alpha/beta fold hydrolase [Hoyosella subflava]|uniref:alpha/beta fold hydrolase n=1 Tax=Hoyosella subflava TaxID=639313 RepID=UPI00059CABB0|nr:alpha/beta fold hydrolase [Hoyosella subflava]